VTVAVSVPPFEVVAVTVTVAAGTLTVPPLLVVMETDGADETLATDDDGTADETTADETELAGTLTTVETVSVPPLLVVSTTETVWTPDELGAGIKVETVAVPPLTVDSVTVTVAAGTLKVDPPTVVTVTVG
jgi:hypothetical protein